jgi:hypothetical protein
LKRPRDVFKASDILDLVDSDESDDEILRKYKQAGDKASPRSQNPKRR